jgi:NADH dehydrogenase
MILVVGGTGHLGRVVVQRLLADGSQVRVLARGAADHADLAAAGAELVAGDIRDPDAVRRAAEGADSIVSAAQGLAGTGRPSPASVDRDGNRNVVDAAAGTGAHVVLLSAVGAGPDHPIELHRMKGEAETYLVASTVPWTIVRGTVFAETWADLLRSSANKSGRVQVFGTGENPTNFVAITDVAEVVVRAVEDPQLRGTAIDVGGPENLTFNDFARLVAPGREPRHVPRAALRVMGAVAGPFQPQLARLARAAVSMDTIDMTFDPGPMRARHPWLASTPITELAP